MTRLEEASERLQRALDNLERVVESQSQRGSGEEVNALRTALLSVKQENQSLKDVAGVASDRLDTVISRLRQVMQS